MSILSLSLFLSRRYARHDAASTPSRLLLTAVPPHDTDEVAKLNFIPPPKETIEHPISMFDYPEAVPITIAMTKTRLSDGFHCHPLLRPADCFVLVSTVEVGPICDGMVTWVMLSPMACAHLPQWLSNRSPRPPTKALSGDLAMGPSSPFAATFP